MKIGKRNTTISLLLLTVVLFFTGCATLFKGTHESVDFNSTPDGAQVYIDGDYRGVTPVRFKLESKNSYKVEFKKEGYQTRIYTITNSVEAKWIILDVIAGLAPVVVDAFTGAWYSLDDDYIRVDLVEERK